MCGGGGVGDRRESPVKTHSIFVGFFACVVVVVVFVRLGGGLVNFYIVCFIE